MELKAFHARLLKDTSSVTPSYTPSGTPSVAAGLGQVSGLPPLPVIRDIDAAAIRENFQKVRQDIINLVNTEMAGMQPI